MAHDQDTLRVDLQRRGLPAYQQSVVGIDVQVPTARHSNTASRLCGHPVQLMTR